MIDQNLINECEKDLDSFGSLMKCQATDLLEAYISLIEQNAEMHKELAKLKAFALVLHLDVSNEAMLESILGFDL